jgi:hypothetical protein
MPPLQHVDLMALLKAATDNACACKKAEAAKRHALELGHAPATPATAAEPYPAKSPNLSGSGAATS